MGERKLTSADDLLHHGAPQSEAPTFAFPMAPGASADSLGASSWIARMVFLLPGGVTPHPSALDPVVAALDGRRPYVKAYPADEALYLRFRTEDGTQRARELLAQVGRAALDLVPGSTITHAEVTWSAKGANGVLPTRAPHLHLVT